MTILQTVENAAVAARLGEFHKCAQLIALHGLGVNHPDAERATPRVQSILRGLAAPIDTVAGGAAIAELGMISEAFSTSLIGLSVFDTVLANGMRRVPLRSRGVVLTTAPSGSGNIAEGAPKPVSEMAFGSAILDPAKAVAIVAASVELLALGSGAGSLFSEELRKAVARATDAIFLASLIATTTPLVSAGTSFANLLQDLGALLAAVDAQPGSKIYLVIPPAIAKQWALMANPAGGLAFPRLSITTGGPLAAGVEALISDQLPANRLLLLVTDGLVGNAEGFAFSKLRQGDIEVTSTPDQTPTAATQLRSLWQSNLAALLCERWFGAEVVRPRALASLSY